MSVLSLRRPILAPRDDPAAFLAADARGGSLLPTRLVATAFVGLVLAVIVPTVFVDWGAEATSSINIVLCLALLAFSGWRLTEAITLDASFVRAVFYVFVYVFLAVPALAQMASGQYPLDGVSYDSDIVLVGLVHIVAGVVAYEIGWSLTSRRSRSAAPAVPGVARRTWGFSSRRAVALGSVGIVMTVYQVGKNGLASFFASRSETSAALTGTDGSKLLYKVGNSPTVGLLVAFLSQFLVFVALYAILYSRRHRLWRKPDLLADSVWRLFIGALIIANVVMNNPMGNGRYWFCLLAVAFASIYLPLDRVRNKRLFVTISLLILFFVFASLDLFRNAKSNLHFSGPSQTFTDNGTYGMFQMELNGVRLVDAQGHTNGKQLLGSLLNFVPRQLWPDKPVATGQLIDPRYARAATAWTEVQIDFGIVGIVVVFLLYGALTSRLDLRASLARPGFLHAIFPLLAIFQIFLLRGSLLPVLGSLYQLVAVFALLATRRRSLAHAAGSTEVGGERLRTSAGPASWPRRPPSVPTATPIG